MPHARKAPPLLNLWVLRQSDTEAQLLTSLHLLSSTPTPAEHRSLLAAWRLREQQWTPQAARSLMRSIRLCLQPWEVLRPLAWPTLSSAPKQQSESGRACLLPHLPTPVQAGSLADCLLLPVFLPLLLLLPPLLLLLVFQLLPLLPLLLLLLRTPLLLPPWLYDWMPLERCLQLLSRSHLVLLPDLPLLSLRPQSLRQLLPQDLSMLRR